MKSKSSDKKKGIFIVPNNSTNNIEESSESTDNIQEPIDSTNNIEESSESTDNIEEPIDCWNARITSFLN